MTNTPGVTITHAYTLWIEAAPKRESGATAEAAPTVCCPHLTPESVAVDLALHYADVLYYACHDCVKRGWLLQQRRDGFTKRSWRLLDSAERIQKEREFFDTLSREAQAEMAVER